MGGAPCCGAQRCGTQLLRSSELLLDSNNSEVCRFNGPVTCVTPGLWGTSTTLCSSARLLLRLGRTMRRCLRFGPGLCMLLFGNATFLWSYDTFMTVSRFVLGSSIRVLVFRRISLIWLDDVILLVLNGEGRTGKGKMCVTQWTCLTVPVLQTFNDVCVNELRNFPILGVFIRSWQPVCIQCTIHKPYIIR
jgi:hypothetical protein